MKFNFFITILLIGFLFSNCNNNRKKLTNNNWIITDGYYCNNKIDFKSTDFIYFTDAYGNHINNLCFFKDSSSILPGINCSNIYAKWTMTENILLLKIDSAKYNSIYECDQNKNINHLKSYLRIDTTCINDSTKQNDSILKNKNPLRNHEFDYAMKVYGNPFTISFDNEILKLDSKTTKIIAKRDRTINNLFKGL